MEFYKINLEYLEKFDVHDKVPFTELSKDVKWNIREALKFFYASHRKIFREKFDEINAQPKIFNRNLIIYFKKAPKDFSLDLFFLYLVKKKSYEIIEQPVIYKKRTQGVSKGGDSLMGKIKLSIRALKFMIKLRFTTYGNNNS